MKQTDVKQRVEAINKEISHRNKEELRSHQLSGLEFILKCWNASHGCILADEMGLGKTCQAIAFLSVVSQDADKQHLPRHLILCPLSVLDTWNRETERFSLGLEWRLYQGAKEERAVLREDLEHTKKSWNVLITTYELFLKDDAFFRSFNWDTLTVDEAHRLKNSHSLLFTTLKDLSVKFILLMTGTPVQNNLDELYSLLCMCAPQEFSERKRDSFLAEYQNKAKHASAMEKLKQLLEKFMLRRTKDAVNLGIPEKAEVIIYHGLTKLQKNVYRAILMKNYDLFSGGSETKSKQRLLNTLVHLRKCVDHPYLFNGIEPEPFEMGDHLIEASGKLILLDSLLQFLKKQGHKVLLFSQMTRMLDILQDYLTYRGYEYERLDGSVRGEERFAAIKRFGKGPGAAWVFLLSTRAGGLGLTLTAADTVVFVDSDFNPQNDIQAAARAHRIGQDKPVRIIRLIAKHSVEEIILARAAVKLKLTEAVMNDSKENFVKQFTTAEISDMLMFGLGELTKTSDDDEESAKAATSNGQNGSVTVSSRLRGSLKRKSDAELELILGTTTAGHWQEISPPAAEPDAEAAETEKQDQQKPTEAFKEQKKEKEAPIDNIYLFEGQDYREMARADRNAADALVAEAVSEIEEMRLNETANLGKGQRRNRATADNSKSANKSPLLRSPRKTKILSPAELEERNRKREEAAELRRQQLAEQKRRKAEEREKKKADLWKKNNYESTNLPLSANDASDVESRASQDSDDEISLGDEGELDAGEGANAEPTFVMGDVTRPHREQRDALIVHCVDNSGNWGQGGVFSAISSRWSNVESEYEQAKKMDDLVLGDAHLIAVNKSASAFTVCLALIVAQERNKRGELSGIKMAALETGLKRIAAYAVRNKCSVHLPRIGYGTVGFNWYGTERLIRKLLCRRGVPVFIYYYDRKKAAKTGRERKRGHSPSLLDEVSDAAVPQSSKSHRSKEARKSPISSDNGEEEDAGTMPEIPSVFAGLKLYLHPQLSAENKRRFKRFVVAYDGEIAASVDDSGTTHAVIPSENADKEKIEDELQKAIGDKSIQVTSDIWLNLCINLKELLPTDDF